MSKVRALARSPARSRSRLSEPRANWGSSFAWTVFLLMVLAIVAAPLVAPHDPNEQDLIRLLEPPSADFLMGTDLLGRDLLSRVIWGGGPPLLVGVLAVLLALAIGVTAGVLAGYGAGMVDSLISRVADIQMSIPGLALALLVLVMLGSNVTNLVLVIAIEFLAAAFPGRAQPCPDRAPAWLYRGGRLGRADALADHPPPCGA